MEGPDPGSLRNTMVDRLLKVFPFKNPAIEAALRRIPRHLFLPGSPLEQVYDSSLAITIRRGEHGEPTSSSSAPDIMGIMLDMLEVIPGQRVLEIGTGSGYNAAVLGDILGPQGRVVSIDLQPDLVEEARQRLGELGFANIQLVSGDGGFGYPDQAPYDRIILTAAASSIAPAWRQQLKPNGLLVMPFELFGQQNVVCFAPRGDELVVKAHSGCGFMPLKGSFGRSFAVQTFLEDLPGVFLTALQDREYSQEARQFSQWLAQPVSDRPSGVSAGREPIMSSLIPWLALCAPLVSAGLWATQAALANPSLPALLGFGGGMQSAISFILFDRDGAAALTAPPDKELLMFNYSDPPPEKDSPVEIFVRQMGPGDNAARTLLNLLETWDRSGRPALDWGSLRVLPVDTAVQALEAGETLIETPWARLAARVRPAPT